MALPAISTNHYRDTVSRQNRLCTVYFHGGLEGFEDVGYVGAVEVENSFFGLIELDKL